MNTTQERHAPNSSVIAAVMAAFLAVKLAMRSRKQMKEYKKKSMCVELSNIADAEPASWFMMCMMRTKMMHFTGEDRTRGSNGIILI